MNKLNVNTENGIYPVIISDTFSALLECLRGEDVKCVIITDENVGELYLETFLASLEKKYSKIYSYVIPAGESNKSVEQTEKIYRFLIEHNIERKDLIFALGGGVIGDLVGFVAATYLRGIRYIQVPTTLLSQADSSVGGKTAVNFLHVKNMIGAFYQPIGVLINYNVLKTLPIREVRNGLVEVLVHAIIKDAGLFAYIEENLDKIMGLEPDVLKNLIYQNCKIKASVVEQDERDNGERAILNFGHTYGHAIESAYQYKYRHGECVAIGIIGACCLAERMHLFKRAETLRIRRLLGRMQVLHTIHDCDTAEILEYIKYDKKGKGNVFCFILPDKIGNVKKYEIHDRGMIAEILDVLKGEEWDTSIET